MGGTDAKEEEVEKKRKMEMSSQGRGKRERVKRMAEGRVRGRWKDSGETGARGGNCGNMGSPA